MPSWYLLPPLDHPSSTFKAHCFRETQLLTMLFRLLAVISQLQDHSFTATKGSGTWFAVFLSMPISHSLAYSNIFSAKLYARTVEGAREILLDKIKLLFPGCLHCSDKEQRKGIQM